MVRLICPRCQRSHSGLCGIPPGVTLGFGARLGGATHGPPEIAHGRPPTAKPGTAVLGELLAQGRQQYVKVIELLRALPPQLPEYTELLDREGKLGFLIRQVEGQIAARRGVK